MEPVWRLHISSGSEVAAHLLSTSPDLTLFDMTVSDEINWGLGAAVGLEALGMTIHSTVIGHHALGDGSASFGRDPIELGAGLTQELDSLDACLFGSQSRRSRQCWGAKLSVLSWPGLRFLARSSLPRFHRFRW